MMKKKGRKVAKLIKRDKTEKLTIVTDKKIYYCQVLNLTNTNIGSRERGTNSFTTMN